MNVYIKDCEQNGPEMNNGKIIKICRLCLAESEVMCPIFTAVTISHNSSLETVALPQRIMSFAQIKMHEGDGLPGSICAPCLAQVDRAYLFKLQCEKSDAELRLNTQMKLEKEDNRVEKEDSDVDGTDGWDVMNFTPEVIINEGTNHNMGDGAGETIAGEVVRKMAIHDKDSYALAKVEEILRNHGTEIKVQQTNGNHIPGPGIIRNGLSDHTYYPMYAVQAMLGAPVARPGPSPFHSPSSGMDEDAMFGRSRRSRDGEKQFKCQMCPKSYSFSSALSRHKAVHNTQLRPFICRTCNKGFADPDKLERHQLTHQEPRSFACEDCGRVFKALQTYEKHRLNNHGQCRMYPCGYCGLSLPTRLKLKSHPCSSRPPRQLTCRDCGKVFGTRLELDEHVGVAHVAERPFACTGCPKRFRHKMNLLDHFQRKHSTLRPYICDYCSARFVTKQELTRHSKKHIPQ